MYWIKANTNLLLVCVSVIVTLLIAEAVLHVTKLKYEYLPPQIPHEYLSFDPELGFDIAPNFPTSTHHFYDYSYPVWSNEFGCYDYPYNGETPYIYVTGDSFTWGFTELPKKWTKVMEAELGVRTVTCGVEGYGTRQEVIKTRRHLSNLPKPELILVGYFANDPKDDKDYLDRFEHCSNEMLDTASPLVPTTTCSARQPHNSFFGAIFQVARTRSVLFSMVYQNLYQPLRSFVNDAFVFEKGIEQQINLTESEEDQHLSEAYWERHERSVAAFKDLAAEYDAKLVFVLIPSWSMTRSATIEDLKGYEIKEFLEVENIDYIDLAPEFYTRRLEGVGGPYYWEHDGHWTIIGNRIAGETVAKYLLEHEFITQGE